ncbi:hypothetical protein EG329_014471 [Mollisiaceae sp. DMI_Dod_QoI]|nr:hypothetical protein EG329_014471 [Helotiales sp. DMI_Dod_QoI]
MSTDQQTGATSGIDQELVRDALDYFLAGPRTRANRLAAMSPEEVERLRVLREGVGGGGEGQQGAGRSLGGRTGGRRGDGDERSGQQGAGRVVVGDGAVGEGGGQQGARRRSGIVVEGGERRRPACQCRACKKLRGEEEEEFAGGLYTQCKIEFR